MSEDWSNDLPIYKQLKEKVVTLILNGYYPEGEALPSVRKTSVDLSINHLTVAKAYQELVDEDLVEKKRGMGMYVKPGARENIKLRAHNDFYTIELPQFVARIQSLGLEFDQVLSKAKSLLEKHHD